MTSPCPLRYRWCSALVVLGTACVVVRHTYRRGQPFVPGEGLWRLTYGISQARRRLAHVKILVGEAAEAGRFRKIERIVAGKEEILDALF